MTTLGTNLDSCKDYAANMAFADCFRMARAWGTAATPYDGKGTSGPDGLPIGDFGAVIFTEVQPTDGTYKLSFTGKADVSTPGSNAKIQNLVYDAAKNLTTADVVVGLNSQLFMSFKNTNGNLKNLSLLRPGCLPGQLFNPAFLKTVRPFKMIRFMDWLQTNGSPIKTWADRKLPTELLQSGSRGVCLEYCIALCNEIGTDAWICIPHMADDDYVVKASQLIKTNLRPELKIYVEYSNEVWNTIFAQTSWNYTQAQADVAAGQKDLSLEGVDTNIYYWGRRRVAKRIAEIGKVFKNNLGAERVRPILANQIADPSVGRAQLQYLAKYYAPVSDVIYGTAGAPYFATKAHLEDILDPITGKATGQKVKAGSTVQTVLDGLKSSVISNVAKWVPQAWDGKATSADTPTLSSLAKFHGVKFLLYECGQHLVSGNDPARQALEKGAQLDPQMYDIMGLYLNGMSPNVDGACYFVNVGGWGSGQYGYWGAQYQIDIETPKSKALAEAAIKLNGPIAPPPSELDQLKMQIITLNGQIVGLTNQVIGTTRQLTEAQAQVTQLQADKKSLQDQLTSSAQAIQALQSKIDNAKAALL